MTAVERFFYESLTLNSAETFFTDRRSGGDRCAEVTVIRGSTVIDNRSLLQSTFFNNKSQKKDEKLLSFSHRAKDGV